jgi:SAM-dependent methyltransferase
VEARDRVAVIEELCRGAKVLDFGCVNHVADAVADPSWLHGRIRAVARECVGADFEAEGIRRMQMLGFDAVHVDITSGLGPLRDRLPFDVCVAGEIIEHLNSPFSLFEAAHEALRPGGLFVLSTPNPYAPHRVRAGQLGLVWESVDHVTYHFPSGIAEFANRAGFALRKTMTVEILSTLPALRRSVTQMVHALGSFVSRTPGSRSRRRLPWSFVSPAEILLRRASRSTAHMGETAIYVLEKTVA